MPDFTIKKYKEFLNQLREKEYNFQTFSEYLKSPSKKVVILRHDVDARKENSLRFARIQYELGITGSYYFRLVPQSYDERVIDEVASMGHEIGYHYETMDSAYAKVKMQKSTGKGQREELIDRAYEEFCINLEKFRKIVPISTICMHGSPRSKYDNKDIWKKYDYHKLRIIGEPYFDIDFNEVAYLTDTGRRWNGSNVSVRDKVESRYRFNFRSTDDIINGIDVLPDKVMFTFHPQRWTDNAFDWIKELVMQNIKNEVKKVLLR